jgi:hypothetical protein
MWVTGTFLCFSTRMWKSSQEARRPEPRADCLRSESGLYGNPEGLGKETSGLAN